MLQALRPILSLLAATGLLVGGAGLLNTLVPLRAEAAGYSNLLLGGLTSAYYSGYLVGTLAMPLMIRRMGHIRAFAFCTAGVACVVLLHAFDQSPLVWLVLRLLAGILLVGLYAIIESWLNSHATPKQHGSVFASYMVVNLCSLALAQQLLRIEGESFLLFSVVAILVCAATLPLAATRQAQPAREMNLRVAPRRLFRTVPTAGIGALLTGLVMGTFWGLQAVYARAAGFDTAAISTYMTVAVLGGALLQWPLGRLSDRHDRRLGLLLVCSCAALMALLSFAADGRPAAMMALVFLYGGFAFAVYPMVMAHLIDHIAAEEIVAATSTVLLVYGLGSAIGPLLAGALMSAVDARALLIWYAAMHGSLAAYAGYRYLIHRRRLTTESNFMPMLRTTPTALEMLPEADNPSPKT